MLLSEREIEDQLRELADAGFRLSLAPEPDYCGVATARSRKSPVEPTLGLRPDGRRQPAITLYRLRGPFWSGSHGRQSRRRWKTYRIRKTPGVATFFSDGDSLVGRPLDDHASRDIVVVQ